SPSHTCASGGTFTVTLTANGAGGASDVERKTNYVQVDGDLDADFTASKTRGPAPLAVQFTDASRGSVAQGWLWDFGDGSISQEQNPSHMFTSDGSYTVTIAVFGFASS